jgi:eukaryotic-like serine/threonine-protein kinase
MIVGRAKVGRYDIERHVASGGMAEVYQASDPVTGGCVALKIPHDGEEIWEAERTGAALQLELSQRDARVPRVYEIGEGDERFVAMEYVEGEDLFRRLQSGPLDWREATRIAIELCGVLATARSCAAPNDEPGGIVHGDIKPRNIRIQAGGQIKVLDFGIAKALRQTRAETRNLYGSVPYSSPERLDRGHVDYTSDLWSVAVVLYEMLEGRRPFRAATDAELERAIRSGAPPAPLERDVPLEFEAVLRKALASALADRYASAQELESDLRAVLLGKTTFAAADRGSAPDLAPPAVLAREDDAVPDATRRTLPATNGSADADATRRTAASSGGAPPPTRASYAQASEASATSPSAPGPTAPAPAADVSARPAAAGVPPWARRVRWRAIVVFAILFFTVREIQALGAAGGLRSTLASRPRGEAPVVWDEYRRVMGGGVLVHASGLGGAVREWMVSHADDLISRYRSDTPTIYESGWRSAEALLQRAATIDPGNRRIQARLEYCRAHLLRIAARDAKQPDESMSRYDEAVSRFERAARLWSGWGDPHVGLAQIYAYGKRDPERTAEALEQAAKARYPLGERETALLGDAYRLRAERRWAGSTDAFDTDQHYRHLERIREDCALALEQYELVPSYAGVSRHLRAMRQRLAEIDARLRALSGDPVPEAVPVWPAPGPGQ